MAMRLLAAACISIMFALVKLASARGVHVVESLFYRFLIGLFLILPWVLAKPGGIRSVRTSRLRGHVVRAVLGTVTMTLNYLSYILLPLAEATTIGYAVPIFATILSAVLLKELVGWHRWSAIIIGFVGILIVIQPGGSHIPLQGALVGLSAAVCTASITVIIRELSTTESTTTIVFWFSFIALPILAVPMLFIAGAHDSTTWLIIAGLGVAGGLGQMTLTSALSLAPISVVMPMDYTTLIWSTALGWLIWSTLPGPTTWIGAPLIVLSGLYIVWRENRNKSAAKPDLTASP
ncbi:MAG: DMT family transporter [Blastomonas sp.]